VAATAKLARPQWGGVEMWGVLFLAAELAGCMGRLSQLVRDSRRMNYLRQSNGKAL